MSHFLFLQGLPGPSMRHIAARLRQDGARTSRINFNGGDWWDWRLKGNRFTGSVEEFAPFLRDFCRREGVDAIVLFGEARPFHRVAADFAVEHGITLYVLEEGYLRPFSVALECWRDGKRWQRPGSLEECELRAAALPSDFAEAQVPAYLRHRAGDAARYWLAAMLLAPFFPGYKTHRLHTPLAELFLWLRRRWRRRGERRASKAALERLGGGSFFLFPLQLCGDASITLRSPFSNLVEASVALVSDFAANAPADAHLVVKRHPYDPGATDWRRLMDHLGNQLGIAERLHFVEFGDLDWLLDNCRGVATVNSTVGQLAVARGRPTKTLGDALYALPGLVHDVSLARFWRDPQPPEPDAYSRFTRALWAECLVNGGFHSREGLDMLARGSAARMIGTPA